MHSGVVEESDLLAQDFGIDHRVAAVAAVQTLEVLVPLVVQPGRAGAAAAVDVEFDASRDEVVIAGGLVRPAGRCHPVDELLGRVEGPVASPEGEDADVESPVGQDFPVGIPVPLPDAGILEAGHAFAVESFHDAPDALDHLLGR